jgi:ubiquinone/menaquinone biosynthesis C-methylase UbiE
MKPRNKKINYDNFHENTTIQKKAINTNNFTYKRIVTTINKYLTPPKKILDIGCGAGTLALHFANEGNQVTGIDVSKYAMEKANQSAKYLHLKTATFKQMNFPMEVPGGKYDFIICSEVIEHIKNDDLALKRMYELLKKGGILFLSTPSENAPMHKLGLAKDFDNRVGHLRRYSVEKLILKAQKQGFIVLETRKTEGIIRNFLFLNKYAGKLVRFVKYFIADIVTFFDDISTKLFGESNIYIILKKP